MKKVLFFISIILVFLFNACSDSSTAVDEQNHPPQILSLVSNPDTIDTGATSLVTCDANDSDGDNLTFVWSADSGAINGSGSSVNWVSPSTAGVYYVKCRVEDGKGGEDVDSVNIVVVQQLPTQGLLAYWPFNGNANDESGNGNNGTVLGAVLTEDRFGNSNSSYSFDGIDDYINIGNNVKPNFPITVSAWIDVNVFQPNGGIFGNDMWNPNSYYHGIHVLSIADGKLKWSVGSGIAASWSRVQGGTNSQVLTTAKWHHVLFIFLAHNNVRMFVDNIEHFGTFAGDGATMNYSSSDGSIGKRWVDHFNGKIDDIRVYTRALTEEEIQALYLENGWN